MGSDADGPEESNDEPEAILAVSEAGELIEDTHAGTSTENEQNSSNE